MKRKAALGLALALVIALAAVVAMYLRVSAGRDDRAFTLAQQAEQGTGDKYELAIEAYQGYLKAYPQGRHAEEARAKVEAELPQRIDEREWARATATDSSQAYKSYLERFPSGKRADQAHKQMAEASRREAKSLEQARATFATGRVVHLYDPQVTGGEYYIRYIVSEAARPGPVVLAVYKVYRGGKSDLATLFRSTAPDLRKRSGTCSFLISAFSDEFSQIFSEIEGKKAERRPKAAADHLEVVVVSAKQESGGGYLVEQSSRTLSNVLRIPLK